MKFSRSALVCALALGTASPLWAQGGNAPPETAAPVQVDLVQVVETRVGEATIEEAKTQPVETTSTVATSEEDVTQHVNEGAALDLVLRLSGPSVKQVLRFGNIQIKSAVTNTGAALKGRPMAELMPTDRPLYFADGADDQTPDELFVHVVTETAPRAAESIKSLEGTIDFYTGQPAKAEFPNAASLKGELKNPALAAAKIGLKRVEPPEELSDRFPNAIFLAITGDPKKILNIHLVEKDRPPYIDFHVQMIDGKPIGIVFGNGEPITPSETLRVVYANELKKTAAPFKLENVRLP